MDDCNVGDYWAVYKDDVVPDGEEGTEESIICAFIRKLVEERTDRYGSQGFPPAHALSIALRDFGIDPTTWK